MSIESYQKVVGSNPNGSVCLKTRHVSTNVYYLYSGIGNTRQDFIPSNSLPYISMEIRKGLNYGDGNNVHFGSVLHFAKTLVLSLLVCYHY